jgi:hypothetical protein
MQSRLRVISYNEGAYLVLKEKERDFKAVVLSHLYYGRNQREVTTQDPKKRKLLHLKREPNPTKEKMIPIRNEQGLFMYRRDPYAVDVLANKRVCSSLDDLRASGTSRGSAGSTTPGAAMLSNERSSSAASLTDSHSDDAGSEAMSSQPSTYLGAPSPLVMALPTQQASPFSPKRGPAHHHQLPQPTFSPERSRRSAATAASYGGAAAPNVRYATVAFKFYTTICAAPFRCSPGDAVVVCDSATGHMNIGVVRSVRSEKPDIPVFLELIRHARDFDRAQKNVCMSQEPEMLAAASAITATAFGSMQSSLVRFCDVELNLDGGFVTFLVDSGLDPSGSMLAPVHALLTQHFGRQVGLRCTAPSNIVPITAPASLTMSVKPPQPLHFEDPRAAAPLLSPIPVM